MHARTHVHKHAHTMCIRQRAAKAAHMHEKLHNTANREPDSLAVNAYDTAPLTPKSASGHSCLF